MEFPTLPASDLSWPVAPQPIGARSSKARRACEELRRQIILGGLAPGAPLTELDLAARFGCSQGTTREALLLLQEEGLVLRDGHRGTRVSPCFADEAAEMIRLRQSLEATGMARVMQKPMPELVADLTVLLGAMGDAAAVQDELLLAELDRDFHRRLFREAGLPALDPILRRCLVYSHRFKISRSYGPRDLHATAERHRPIIEAVARQDAAGAVETLRHHIATIVDFGPEMLPEAKL